MFFVAHTCRVRRRRWNNENVSGQDGALQTTRPSAGSEQGILADTGCPKSQGWVKIAERSKRQTCDEPTSCGKDVADATCELREWDRRTWNGRSESPNGSRRAVESGLGMLVDGPAYWLDGYWRVEPNIPRVATGVKNRVDRLRCLGNAVVPQQVYPILKAIAEIETR